MHASSCGRLAVDPVVRRLWDVPVVLNQGSGAKAGLVIGQGAVTVDHDGRVETRAGRMLWPTTLRKNYERCRVEGRFGVSVNQPPLS